MDKFNEFESLNHPTPVLDEPEKFSFKRLMKHPIVFVFFLIIMVFMLSDIAYPDKDISELENKPLRQNPTFNLEDFFANKWTLEYTEYLRDQFIFRDDWISLQSFLEGAQGKIENNGIWYGKDGYQIASNLPVASQTADSPLPEALVQGLSSLQLRLLPNNITAISNLARDFDGRVSVMIVPSPANVLSDKLRYSPPQYNENAMLDYMFNEYTKNGANVVDLRPVFEEHKDEYLFYRTDHHWTTTGGAWLAYENFMKSNGMEPVKPDESLLVTLDGFLGTNYAKSKKSFTKADTLEYYNLPNRLTINAIQQDGSTKVTTGPIMDYEKLEVYDKYAAFLHGNNGFSMLEGNGSGNVLIIKDSYANSLAPYLVENYANIGIIDPRVETNVNDYINSGEWDEILILYGFNTFSTEITIYRIQAE